MTTTAKRTNPRGTKKYKTLIALNYTDGQALDALAALGVDVSGVTPRSSENELLVAAGFTPEQADNIEASQPKRKKKKAKKGGKHKAKQNSDLTPKQAGESLVAQRGLAFTRGRVYSNGDIIEAQVRVLKTGKPEVVATSGVGRIAAVLVYREDSGDVALQNLARPV